MYEKPGERGEGVSLRVPPFSSFMNSPLFLVLDDRIDDMAELIRDYYKIQELSDPSASTDVGIA